MRIFAIDDERLALMKIEDTVREEYPTCEFQAFNFVEDYFETIKKTPCDIVFTDIEMPTMTGVELAKKTMEILPNCNIVFLTGYSEYKADAMDMFASGYILKPITAEKLKKVMEHLRHPIVEGGRLRVSIHPHFHVYCGDEPLMFERGKTTDLLAFLVYNQGKKVSAQEIKVAVFGEVGAKEPSSSSYFHHLKSDLANELKNKGLEDILWFDKRNYSIDFSRVDFGCTKERLLSTLKEEYGW